MRRSASAINFSYEVTSKYSLSCPFIAKVPSTIGSKLPSRIDGSALYLLVDIADHVAKSWCIVARASTGLPLPSLNLLSLISRTTSNTYDSGGARSKFLRSGRLNSTAVGEASRNARAAGYTPNAIQRIISTPSDVSMFSRLPEADQWAILRQANDKEFERYVTHARSKIRAQMREQRAGRRSGAPLYLHRRSKVWRSSRS
jgi:hypothetical protein